MTWKVKTRSSAWPSGSTRDDLVVLLGTPTEAREPALRDDGDQGDPSWAGALAGVSPRLPVYHITESAVRERIAAPDYDEHVALMAMAMDVDAIARAVRDVREDRR